MSWFPLLSEGGIGHAEVIIMGLPPLPTCVRGSAPCLVCGEGTDSLRYSNWSHSSLFLLFCNSKFNTFYGTLFSWALRALRLHHKFWVGQPWIIFPSYFLFWNLTRLVFCLKCKIADLSKSSHVLVCSYLFQVFRALILGSVVLCCYGFFFLIFLFEVMVGFEKYLDSMR